MIYFAHRGASAYLPHNSLSAFAFARELGATCYELDVHLTKDRQIVVHHDYSLLSATGYNVNIKDIPAVQLSRYPLLHPYGSNLRAYVPTFQEVLDEIKPGLELLNIELKNDENIYPGVEALLLTRLHIKAPRLLPKILFSSFDYDTLLRIRRTDKEARIGWLCREFDLQKALSIRAESVHMSTRRITPEIVRICHGYGLKVYVYTVNTKEEAARLYIMGADGIFTDKIDLFVKP